MKLFAVIVWGLVMIAPGLTLDANQLQKLWDTQIAISSFDKIMKTDAMTFRVSATLRACGYDALANIVYEKWDPEKASHGLRPEVWSFTFGMLAGYQIGYAQAIEVATIRDKASVCRSATTLADKILK